ncbi:hypothetical protein Syun_022197 [Stephania yunnanensis]|uniref:Sister chromatid cohesion 1 protein 3 n=1 Tax=Stephania yunnanensis TaxID=152371 RepID=A0AAP0IHH9_9MAGN
MFYSHTFLARKSALGTVWIAAHLQHKLRKNHVTVTDISTAVDFIMFPEVPIALRLSAHLLLGVVRIYSKKVDYLHHDCTEALSRIKTAFASANDINLPEDATTAPFHSITLPETFELDALDLLDDWNFEGTLDNHLKSREDITMTDQAPGMGDPYVAFFINEDVTVATLPLEHTVNDDVSPMGEDAPPNSENIGADVPVQDPSNQSKELDQKLAEDRLYDGLSELDATMMDAHPNNLPDWIESDNVLPEEHEIVQQIINDKENISPVAQDISESGGRSMPFQLNQDSPPNLGFAPSFDNSNSHDMPGHVSPNLAIQPTPPQEKKRPRERKRKLIFDSTVVLSNDFMKKLLDNPSALVSKRRKLPCSALDVWKFKNRSRMEQNFFESSISGLHENLQVLSKEDFISSKVRKFVVEASSPERLRSRLPTPPRLPTPLPGIDNEIGHSRFPDHHHHEDSLHETRLSPLRNYEFTPPSDGNLWTVPETGNILEAEELLLDIPASVETNRSDIETPFTHMDGHSVMEETGLPTVQEFSSLNEDLYFLDADNTNTPTGHEGNESHTLSVRTRAVAQYLKQQSPATEAPKDKIGTLSLNKILEGRTRKQCARMLYETLVLKNYGIIDVEQKEAYGDITLLLTPLANAKF